MVRRATALAATASALRAGGYSKSRSEDWDRDYDPVQPGPDAESVGVDVDLREMDDAFGDFCDLYSDVLGIGANASSERIRRAYLDRRADLLAGSEALPDPSKSKRANERHADLLRRRLDAAAAAVRLLEDPRRRRIYDDALRSARVRDRRRAVRGELPGDHDLTGGGGDEGAPRHDDVDEDGELSRRAKRDRKRKTLLKANRKLQKEREMERLRQQRYLEDDDDDDDDDSTARDHRTASTTKKMSNRGRRRDVRQEADDDEVTLDNTTITGATSVGGDRDETHDDGTHADSPDASGSSCFSRANRRANGVLQALRDEISGACEDAMVSADQVLNAFTLTERDILAVTERIDRVKRQLG